MAFQSKTKPVAKPVKRRKAARPGEIIAAGFLEFSKNGYAGTRLSDIAHRAGIAKGTIYRYFDDKEALFLAAIKSHTTPTFDHMDQIIDEFDGTTHELLTHLFRIVHNTLVQGDMHTLLRIIILEGKNFPQLPKHYHREGISKGQKVLARIIERGIQRGEVRKNAASNLPMVLMAPALMAAIWKMIFSQQQPIDPEEFYRAHVDLVLQGILIDRQ